MIHNLFRLWELIFGRKKGIRIENTTLQSGSYIVREFYTTEALLAYWEACFYSFLKSPFRALARLPKLKVYVPVTAGYTPQYPGYVFAIALDATTVEGIGADASPDTSTSHTTSGTDRGLIFSFSYGGGGTLSDVTSITYNGDSLSSEGSGDYHNARWTSIWSLIAPDTGANTATVTWSGTKNEKTYGMTTFTGVDQTTMVEATAGSDLNYPANPTSLSVTTLTDDAWVYVNFVSREARTYSSMDTGTFLHNNPNGTDGGVGTAAGYNSGGTAGSYTVAFNWNLGESGRIIGAAIKPASGGGGGSTNNSTFFGGGV